MKTLRTGSLARNTLTFCWTKCFFFVLVLGARITMGLEVAPEFPRAAMTTDLLSSPAVTLLSDADVQATKLKQLKQLAAAWQLLPVTQTKGWGRWLCSVRYKTSNLWFNRDEIHSWRTCDSSSSCRQAVWTLPGVLLPPAGRLRRCSPAPCLHARRNRETGSTNDGTKKCDASRSDNVSWTGKKHVWCFMMSTLRVLQRRTVTQPRAQTDVWHIDSRAASHPALCQAGETSEHLWLTCPRRSATNRPFMFGPRYTSSQLGTSVLLTFWLSPANVKWRGQGLQIPGQRWTAEFTFYRKVTEFLSMCGVMMTLCVL